MKSQRLNRYKGTASEHFACADIWLQGYKAYLIPSDVFDLILKAENHLLKLQVKSSSFSTNKNSSVSFNLTRGCNSKDKYNKEDIDGWITHSGFEITLLDGNIYAYFNGYSLGPGGFDFKFFSFFKTYEELLRHITSLPMSYVE